MIFSLISNREPPDAPDASERPYRARQPENHLRNIKCSPDLPCHNMALRYGSPVVARAVAVDEGPRLIQSKKGK